MSILWGFISKYFLEGIIVIVLGIVTKIAQKYLSNDRIAKIKEGILTAMLYAEEFYGIGQGTEKWQLAWKKLIEILQKQGITLSEKEKSLASDLMRANVPEVNQITYSALPDTERLKRSIPFRNPETTKLVDKLRRKHQTDKLDEKSIK